jgi:hypothetical protein
MKELYLLLATTKNINKYIYIYTYFYFFHSEGEIFRNLQSTQGKLQIFFLMIFNWVSISLLGYIYIYIYIYIDFTRSFSIYT